MRGVGIDGYDLVDLKALGESASADGALGEALDGAVVYHRSNEKGANGLSVYHPLWNKEMYLTSWGRNYDELGISPGYTSYIKTFGRMLTGVSMTDWSGLETVVEETGERNSFVSVRLTDEQAENLQSAQLIILKQMPFSSVAPLAPVWRVPAKLGEDGVLTAEYDGKAIYVTDPQGNPLISDPVSYIMFSDGDTIRINAWFEDYSRSSARQGSTHVLYECSLDQESGKVDILRTYVYDNVTESYTNRIEFVNEGFTQVGFWNFLREEPLDENPLPGFDGWEGFKGYAMETMDPNQPWEFRVFDTQLDGSRLFATVEVTDTQTRAYCSPLVEMINPNVREVEVSGGLIDAETVSGTVTA